MPITEAQREQRQKYLGSSDMAAVMGLDSWGNAHDVYLEKTGKLDPEKDKAVFRRGNYMEAALLAYAQDELGRLITEPSELQFINQDLHLCSHPDAMLIDPHNVPVEAKSLGWFAPDHWGDADTDQCPDRTLIQTHVHMICTDADFCYVPVYLPKREFQMYGVPLDKELAETICEAAVAFWDDHVVKDIPPQIITPSMAVLKRVRRLPETTAEISDELVGHWLNAKDTMSLAKKAQAKAQAELITALGQAEGGECPAGMVTYFEQTRKEYVSPETTFRVLRFKKEKA